MKTRIILSLLFGFALVAGCKNSTIVENSNVGTFRGNIALLNAMGDTLPNYAGVTAQIEGTTFQATSNTAGDWEIDNVPAGIYNIMLTKAGFDTLIIPQYQFSGAGTSFVVGNAIQAMPQDSLVISLNNTIEETYKDTVNHTTGYLGLLTVTGNLAGPDSLIQASIRLQFGAADSNGSTINTYIVNGQLPAGTSRGYSVPQDYKSGTVVTVSSSVWGIIGKTSYSHYQQAISPYSVVRTFILP